jgi:hypothetical protein
MEDNMIAPTQIRKPENWQDFEKLCKKLWGEVWQCSDTIQRNGRQGQSQKGIDVYGMPKGIQAYYGIQCKGKDDYTNAQLTEQEIDREINKALSFEPKLARMIFATTANKDASIEEYVRKKNIEHIKDGKFEVCVSSWEDIVDLMEEHRNTYKWYLNNCQYKDTSDVKILFSNGSNICGIHPQYIKTIKKTVLKEPPIMPESLRKIGLSIELWRSLQDNNMANKKLIDILKKTPDQSLYNPSYQKTDYRWCKLIIDVMNAGNTTLEDFKLYILFDNADDIEKIDTGFNYNNNVSVSDSIRAQINDRIDRERNVFKCSDGSVLYEPKKPLVQTDSEGFDFDIIPQENVKEINISWDFKSRDYHKTGKLLIKVEPDYEENLERIEVDDINEMVEDEITIRPKIK